MDNRPQHDNSRIILALVLIGIGALWMLRKMGFYIDFPHIHLNEIFHPFGRVFHGFWHFIFSWPMILIVIGLILMAGKRSAGLVLLIIGAIFILPKIFIFSFVGFSLLIPLIIIGVGIAIVARIL